MTKIQAPGTKSHVTETELVLVSPKTGLLLHIPRMPLVEAGPAAKKEHDDLTKLMQEIVDCLNEAMNKELI